MRTNCHPAMPAPRLPASRDSSGKSAENKSVGSKWGSEKGLGRAGEKDTRDKANGEWCETRTTIMYPRCTYVHRPDTVALRSVNAVLFEGCNRGRREIHRIALTPVRSFFFFFLSSTSYYSSAFHGFFNGRVTTGATLVFRGVILASIRLYKHARCPTRFPVTLNRI